MNRLQKFADWLENVFWYHYKWYWVLGVAAAAFAALSLYGNITEIHYDWKIAVYDSNLLEDFSSNAATAEVFLTGFLPDYNGDGKTQAEFVYIAETPDIIGDVPLFTAFSDSDIYALVSDLETLTEWQSYGFLGSIYPIPSEWPSFASVGLKSSIYPFPNGKLYAAVCNNPPAVTDVELARANGYSDAEIAEMDAAIAAQRAEKTLVIDDALQTIDDVLQTLNSGK